MSTRFLIQFFASVLFGFVFEQIYRTMPSLCVFVAGVMLAQMYLQIMESKKKVSIQVSSKKFEKFAESMQKFKK